MVLVLEGWRASERAESHHPMALPMRVASSRICAVSACVNICSTCRLLRAAVLGFLWSPWNCTVVQHDGTRSAARTRPGLVYEPAPSTLRVSTGARILNEPEVAMRSSDGNLSCRLVPSNRRHGQKDAIITPLRLPPAERPV